MPKLSNSKGKQVVKEEAAQTSYTMWSKQLPQFERVITACNLSRGSVYFPRGITISDHLRNKSRIIATNYSGRKWPLRLRRDPTSRVITTGWRQFISDNGVELGDKFIFQFVSERVVRIQVQKKLQLQMIDSF
ncbi:B3 domain-containing protein [Canna indica]|uniref:B3 domain-containing protein n=1 Tax=Canna indica TaxID=4628 RepID=A0AAQ3JN81_9LILI|nr:B3 domain-containing protein [Canna indica]